MAGPFTVACIQTNSGNDLAANLSAALALAQRYNLDSRDQGKQMRQDVIFQNEGVWECTFVGECSEVCPKHVDPAGAIQQAKLEGAFDYYKRLLTPWVKRS